MHEVLFGHGEIWGWEEGVYYQSEDVVEHGWDDAGHEGGGEFEAGVGVAFDDVNFEVTINHKIVPKNLKRVLPPMRINFRKSRIKTICHQPRYLRHQIFPKIDFLLRKRMIQIPLKLLKRYLIPALKSPVLFTRLLYRVISKMHKSR